MKKLLAVLLFFFAITAFTQDDQVHEVKKSEKKEMPQEPEPNTTFDPAIFTEAFQQKISYILGNQLGNNLKKDEIPVSFDFLVRGLEEGLAGKKAYSDQEIQTAMRTFQKEIQRVQSAKHRIEAKASRAKAMAFLEENKKKEGIQVTESGLQYRIIKEADGPKARRQDKVTVHYRGRLVDGTEFDSSYKRNQPATFNVAGVIPGWIEAMQLIPTGGKWELFIPPDLGYGPRGAGQNIPGNAVLIFVFVLLEVIPQEEEEKKEDSHHGHKH